MQRTERSAGAVRLALAGVPFVFAAIYLGRGSGYVLDDWFTLRETALEGGWHPVPGGQVGARPGAALLWVLQFGAFGRHPVPSFLLMAALTSVAALLLHRLLLLVVPAGIAHGAALLWVLLPTHTSLEAWHSCSEITLSLALGLLALLVALRPGAWRVVAVVLAAAAGLSYEAVIPALGAVGLLLPLLRPVRQKLWSIASIEMGAIGALLWVGLHFSTTKHVNHETSDLTSVLPANFGWGVAPHGPWAVLTGAVALGGLLAVLAGRWLPTLGIRPLERRAVLACCALLALGALPFLRYPFAPLGAGDRENYVSAIGGSLALSILGTVLLRWWRPLGIAAGVALAVSAGVVRAQRMDLWSRAGLDAGRAYDEVVRRKPDPGAVLVFGPQPLQVENIAAFADDSNVNGLVQLAAGTRAGGGRLSYDPADFARIPPAERVDLCPISSLPHRDRCRAPTGP